MLANRVHKGKAAEKTAALQNLAELLRLRTARNVVDCGCLFCRFWLPYVLAIDIFTSHGSFTGTACDADGALAVVRDAGFAGDDVIGDNGAADGFTELDLRFVLAEFTATNQNRSALDLERGSTLFLVVPLNESAIAKADGAFAGNFGDLVARTPESAIHEPHTTGIGRAHSNHSRVRPVE